MTNFKPDYKTWLNTWYDKYIQPPSAEIADYYRWSRYFNTMNYYDL